MKNFKFAAFILSHGRPDNVKTYRSLRSCGYTGDIYIILDNEDNTIEEYKKTFENVIVFDKLKTSKSFDECDNFGDRRAIVYARNESFKIAKDLGLDYFIQLDDDYSEFIYRFDQDLNYYSSGKKIKNLDFIFDRMVNYLRSSNLDSLAMAQGGDFIGGSEGSGAELSFKRKCMNSFICKVNNPFKFIGRINEDVNTYTYEASKGLLLGTINQISLNQQQTQSSSGGMTDIYLHSGTYVKSFYSVMIQPSAVKISLMGSTDMRLHHRVKWDCAVPKILSDDFKKQKMKVVKK